jgi:putative intracellular protease/amidase
MKSIIIICTLILFAGFGAWKAFAQTKPEPKLNVGILVFNDVQIIDYTGPYEVLGANGKRNVFLVAEKLDAITTNMGMRVIPNYSFENAPKIDILILPGGGNISKGDKGRAVGAQLQNPKVMKWVKDTAAQAKYVMSVCNGAFFLAASGLLENLPATTTSGFIPSLTDFSPTTKPVYDKRFVDNGKIITTAGLSSGIDGALHLVEKLEGRGWAKQTALGLEYDWKPEGGFSRAALAEYKLPNSLGRILTGGSAPIDSNGDRGQWEEVWTLLTSDSPAAVIQNMDKYWADEKGWTKVASTEDRTSWKFTEASGQVWNAWVSAEPSEEKGKLIFRFGIKVQEQAKQAVN